MRYFHSRALRGALGSALCLTLLTGLVSGCTNRQSPQTTFGDETLEAVSGGRVQGRLGQILVTDPLGQPVAGARIMIGLRPDAPFAGNVLLTDKAGIVETPMAWTSAQPVTIEAEGYIRATYLGRAPENTLNLIVKPQPAVGSAFELTGETTGYGTIRDDGYLDLGLVLPTFNRQQVATMHINDIFAREADSLTVLGREARIPSNLSVPSQTKTYIFPIHFAKPGYRLQYPKAGTYMIEGLHARVKISEAVDHIRAGGSLLDLINKFTFTEGGVIKANVQKGGTYAPLPINGFAVRPAASFTAPSFDASLDMFTGVLPKADGQYFLSDLKKLKPGQKVQLSAPVGATRGLLVHFLRKRPANNGDILVGADGATQSMVLVNPSRGRQNLEFLDIVPAPVREGKSGLKLTPPKKTGKLDGSMTYLLLSKVEVIDNGSYKLEKAAPEWELYGSEWLTNVTLPELPPARPPTDRNAEPARMRWEASFVGQMNGAGLTPKNSFAPGPEEFEKATHVTRSALDF